ncbi:YqiA/YcfP family alpha/beta fold hydrolase [Salibacter halophilus]|uniref:Alpha/beta hydrolase n=1 Tax=Salibacter halophilus TaxID=1803916 RepID=A0A6N6M5I8_9FLAO|nr:YqiA/YcfP family alpha/beta fold hydrolase [Salibacter halophilus]KAB1064879.1 hypothetical protein F3059_05860 [Salibacter halophilus]
MSYETVKNTDAGIYEDLSGSDKLLVTFGGVNQGVGVPVFEFFNTISNIECDKILIRDHHQAWYQKGVDNELNSFDKIKSYLEELIEKNDYKKVLFLGNSMGGYAAILLGTLIDVHHIIAFAPQSFIDPFYRFIYRDKRWKEQMKNVHNCEQSHKEYFDLKAYLKQNQSYKSSILIYFSSSDRLDKIHAERLKLLNGVSTIKVLEGGHTLVKTLRDRGELKRIIEGSL